MGRDLTDVWLISKGYICHSNTDSIIILSVDEVLVRSQNYYSNYIFCTIDNIVEMTNLFEQLRGKRGW